MQPVNDLKDQLQHLYNQNRYLDAYRLVEPVLSQLARFQPDSADMLIEMGRLCGRLGSQKLRFKLFSRARKQAPHNPLVRLYAGRKVRYRQHLLVQLKELDKPTPVFASPSQKAIWLGSYALMLTAVRDFERAHQFVERARVLNVEAAWVSYCRAELLNSEDRWEEALVEAEESWRLSPGMPQTAEILGKILTKRSDLEKAIQHLLPVAEQGQSYETLMIAMWYLCAQAERSDASRQHQIASRAYELSKKLNDLAPLADAAAKSAIAACRMDIILLLQDQDKMAGEVSALRSPFYKKVVFNTLQNERVPRQLLPFETVFQAHQTCLPTSVAAVLGRFGIKIDVTALAQELTFKGTALWRIMEWLEAQNLLAKPFITDPDITRNLITAGLPFVYLMESVQFFHATAAVGLDLAAGLVILHDPSQIRWDMILLSEIGLEEKPFGPEALAIVPATHAHLLELIPEAASFPYAQFQHYLKTWETRGAKAGEPIIASLADQYPDHPFTKRLKGIHYALTGRLADAIQIQEALLFSYPDSAQLRREMLDSLYRTGNTARIRNTLKNIVVRQRMPGIRAKQKWRYPPAEYIAKYADYIGSDKTGFEQAENVILKALAHEPFHGLSYHILGDVWLRQGRLKDCLLPYRCAATLEYEDNHYARAFCDALRKIGRVEEGLQFLVRRAEKLGNRLHGGSVWIALISAYEDYGYPDLAIENMLEASAMREKDAELQSFAASFWIRMGYWEKAEKALTAVESAGHRLLYLKAATLYYQRSGDWQRSLALVSDWIRENPDDILAHKHYAHLITLQHGRLHALEQTRQWMRRRPGNDAFEDLHYNMLKHLNRERAQKKLLEKRVLRNPQEAWAWRELGFCLVNQLYASVKLSAKDRSGLKIVLENCELLCPDQEATWALKADLAEAEGDFRKAVEYSLRALALNPSYAYCYKKAWTCSNRFSIAEQEALVEQLQQYLFHSSGFLYNACQLAFLIAERFGAEIAGTIVEKWLQKAPGDPEVVKARADLLLYYSQDVSDAEKAAFMLEAETVRFPNHHGLHYSLSNAYRIMGAESKQMAVLEDILRRNPLDHSVRNRIATVLIQDKQIEAAVALLNEGLRFDPESDELYHAITTILAKTGHIEAAVSLMERSLHILPDSISMRRHCILLLQETGNGLKAIDVARQGTRLNPFSAYHWFLLGEALAADETHAHHAEIEAAHKKAVSLNPNLLEALERLVYRYCQTRRFEDARKIVKNMIKRMKDPSGAHILMAQIERYAGNNKRAVKQLSHLLGEWPKTPTAWKLLIHWLKEDLDWRAFAAVLPQIPQRMQDDPDFTAEKLVLMEQIPNPSGNPSGVPAGDLDQLWQALLTKFPDNEYIHNLRFDLLARRGRWKAAGQVNTAIANYHPDSALVWARKIHCQAAQSGQEASDNIIDQVSRLWFRHNLDDHRAIDYTWQVIESQGLRRKLLASIYNLLQNNDSTYKQLHWRAFDHLIENLDCICHVPGAVDRFKIFFRLSEDEIVTKLKALLHANTIQANGHGYFQGRILERLIQSGDTAYVLSYWRKNSVLCAKYTHTWQIIGSLLTRRRIAEYRAAVKWLMNWRDYPDCEMWAVANYVAALVRANRKITKKSADHEIIAVCRDALDRLPYDRSIKYIVSMFCITCLRNGRDEEFIDCACRFEQLLADEFGEYWIDREYAWAPKIILGFKELLQSRSVNSLKTIPQDLHQSLPAPAARWIRREWRRRVKARGNK